MGSNILPNSHFVPALGHPAGRKAKQVLETDAAFGMAARSGRYLAAFNRQRNMPVTYAKASQLSDLVSVPISLTRTQLVYPTRLLKEGLGARLGRPYLFKR